MSNSKITSRRRNALTRLEAQLVTGTKPEKIEGKTTANRIPLTEGNIKRINAEILTLSTPKKKAT